MDSHASTVNRAVLLAIAATLAAPACMAQQASDHPEAAGTEGSTTRNVAPEAGDAPRSAFGHVMSLLIAELKRNADTPGATAPTDDPGAAHAAAAVAARLDDHDGVQQIQVSDRFRLDKAPAVAKGE